MPLSPEEIEGKHFLMALRGYDKDQVDAFLKELAAEQQALLHSADAASEAREASGSRTGRDPFEGFTAQLESILRHAAEQADHIRSAAADDVARQLEAARQELVKAGTIRAAAEQEAAVARRELENARSVVAKAERQAEAAAQLGARAAERLEAAEQEAAEVLEAAKREAAEVRDVADRERQQSANVLEAAEEELRAALQLRAEREKELGTAPVTRTSNQPRPGAHLDRGDPSRATTSGVWFPFADD